MNRKWVGIAMLGLLSLSACEVRHDENSSNMSEQPTEESGGTTTPVPPTKDQIAAYNKDMVKKALAMGQCRVAKLLVLNAMRSNNPYEMYEKAQEGKDACHNAQSVINGFDFTYLQNDDLTKKIKDGMTSCTDSALNMQLAFDIISKVANDGAPARPSDVDEIQISFSKADSSWKDCGQRLDKIDNDAGLMP